MLHLYKALLAARRASPALSVGSLELLDAPDGVLAWERRAGDDVRRVVVSFVGHEVAFPCEGWVPEVGTHDGFAGVLRADEALVLRPA